MRRWLALGACAGVASCVDKPAFEDVCPANAAPITYSPDDGGATADRGPDDHLDRIAGGELAGVDDADLRHVERARYAGHHGGDGEGEHLHVLGPPAEEAGAAFGERNLEACVFALIAGALYCGVKLSPPRIVLVLILFHMALSHVRNIEIFALLMPLVVLSPLSSQFGLHGARFVKMTFPFASAATLVAILGLSTWIFAASHKFSPTAIQSPTAAVDVLKDRNARRVLNDLPFAGYLISREMPVFIDGRAEVYGESFEMAYYRALQLQDVNLFLDILKTYEIDAVLLTPSTPAASLLDHLDGWQRVYSDETAVLHIRTAH